MKNWAHGVVTHRRTLPWRDAVGLSGTSPSERDVPSKMGSGQGTERTRWQERHVGRAGGSEAKAATLSAADKSDALSVLLRDCKSHQT